MDPSTTVIWEDWGSEEVSLAALVVGRMSFAFPATRSKGISFEPMWPDAAVINIVGILILCCRVCGS